MYPEETIIEVIANWGLTLKKIHREVNIEGSPERSDFRVVFETKARDLYILEQVSSSAFERKLNIANMLEFLENEGTLFVHSYLSDKKGNFLINYDDVFWQIIPFIKGVKLDRHKYINDKWRGVLFADFLIDLKEKSCDIAFFQKKNVFSIKNFIYELMTKIKFKEIKLFEGLIPGLEFLERDFMAAHDEVPISFCHGDFHPLNVIWGKKDIKSIIDWEFCGYKPECYDVANMIGCLGMENPSCLQGVLVDNFITTLKKGRFLSDISWKYLIEFIVAIRFAWMSEWLRKSDKEMVELELFYMKLLVEKKDLLKEIWLL